MARVCRNPHPGDFLVDPYGALTHCVTPWLPKYTDASGSSAAINQYVMPAARTLAIQFMPKAGAISWSAAATRIVFSLAILSSSSLTRFGHATADNDSARPRDEGCLT